MVRHAIPWENGVLEASIKGIHLRLVRGEDISWSLGIRELHVRHCDWLFSSEQSNFWKSLASLHDELSQIALHPSKDFFSQNSPCLISLMECITQLVSLQSSSISCCPNISSSPSDKEFERFHKLKSTPMVVYGDISPALKLRQPRDAQN